MPLPGFQFAADYFKIKITDAIQQASTQRVLDGCRLSGIAGFLLAHHARRAG